MNPKFKKAFLRYLISTADELLLGDEEADGQAWVGCVYLGVRCGARDAAEIAQKWKSKTGRKLREHDGGLWRAYKTVIANESSRGERTSLLFKSSVETFGDKEVTELNRMYICQSGFIAGIPESIDETIITGYATVYEDKGLVMEFDKQLISYTDSREPSYTSSTLIVSSVYFVNLKADLVKVSQYLARSMKTSGTKESYR